jgi:hypothetical protein
MRRLSAFGKTRWHPREAAWVTPLTAAEQAALAESGDEQQADPAECLVNQRTLRHLLARLTESSALVRYFVHWERRVAAPAVENPVERGEQDLG